MDLRPHLTVMLVLIVFGYSCLADEQKLDNNDAAVVCRQMGCGRPLSVHSRAHFGQGTGPIHLDNVACSGSESSITDCHCAVSHNCAHSEDAGVTCADNIRLVNGKSRCDGRVKIYLDGEWGTVCDDNWDINDAKVVCKQMRCGSAVIASQGPKFGPGSGSIILDKVGCSGSEISLTSCSHRGLKSHNCNHGEDAGVVCSDALPSPTITLISTNSAVLPGESVQFRCSFPYSFGFSVDFHLYKNGGSVKTQTAQSSSKFSLNVDTSDQGQYSCDYSFKTTIYFTSSRSSSVGITVVTLPTPCISLSPTQKITRGERVDITCSLKTHFTGGTFTLKTSSGSVRERKSGTTATFSFPEVDFVHEGSYYCQYQTQVSSRDFSSPKSSSVSFVVTVNLLQPNISFSYSDVGSYWGPKGLEVTKGYSFSLICSTQPQYLGGLFHLEFSGINFTRITQSAVNHSATFSFPGADYVHQGNYSCVYEVSLSSHTFKSLNSELLGVTVRASLAPFIGSGMGIGLTLLIFVPILIFFIRRCKKQEQQMDGKMVYKQRARNTYDTAHGMNEMDKDDEDYENADCFQQDSDDSDQDYINVNLKEEKISVDNDYTGNEMEDDDDYENVEKDCVGRQAVAVNFEDEDIYTNVDYS